jgi:hypothetical protein
VGVTHTPICGQFLCGDGTLCGAWSASFGRPVERLDIFAFAFSNIPSGVTGVALGKPKLFLNARHAGITTDTGPSFQKPKLILSGKPFVFPPQIRLFPGRPRLILNCKLLLLGKSQSVSLARPKLVLNGGEFGAGTPGLLPSQPQSVTLAPTVIQAGQLTPSPAQAGPLTPTTPEPR